MLGGPAKQSKTKKKKANKQTNQKANKQKEKGRGKGANGRCQRKKEKCPGRISFVSFFLGVNKLQRTNGQAGSMKLRTKRCKKVREGQQANGQQEA